jgi:hypothetical protein
MRRILCFVSLAAVLTGGCAWYKIQPISADSLNGWGRTNCLPAGYIFYQPELYFLATIVTEADFTFNFENGWKLTSIADKGDNSTVANTLANQLTTALKAAEGLKGTSLQQPSKTRVILYRPKFNKNGYFNGFEPVDVPITE